MYRNAAHILSVCKDLYHWPERIKVGDNQIISQNVTIRNKSKRGNTYDSYRNYHAAQVA